MKNAFYHFQLNVSDATKSIPFYKNLFKYLGFKTLYESEDSIAASDGSVDFWIFPTKKELANKKLDRDATGFNHFAIKVDSKEAVDAFCENFLKPNNIPALFETPRNRPEFRKDGVYYQVLFEDPDGMLLEIVYIE